jgi:hypothetical protein
MACFEPMNEASAPSCKNATYPEDGLQLLDLAYVAPWSQTDQPHLRGISRPLVWNLELRRGGSGGSGVGNPSKLTNRLGTERRGPNPHSDLQPLRRIDRVAVGSDHISQDSFMAINYDLRGRGTSRIRVHLDPVSRRTPIRIWVLLPQAQRPDSDPNRRPRARFTFYG